MNLEWVAKYYKEIQLGLFVLSLFYVIRLLKQLTPESQFKVREADRLKQNTPLRSKDSVFENKPKALPGFVSSDNPYQVLGIPEGASEDQIQAAYRDAMKRFHPDRAPDQRPETLRFYQESAQKIIEAKEKILSRKAK